jgi:hypothetical protein
MHQPCMHTAKIMIDLGSLRDVICLVWTDASRFVKMRLATVLGLVTTASVLTALGPVALKLVVDGSRIRRRASPLSPFLLIGLSVSSQGLAGVDRTPTVPRHHAAAYLTQCASVAGWRYTCHAPHVPGEMALIGEADSARNERRRHTGPQ